MTKNTIGGVPKARPSGRQLHLWAGAPLTAMTLVLAACVGLAGCGKPPTWSELVNGKKKEAPPAPPVATTSTKTPPSALPLKAPEKPKRTPQEVIAEFNATPAERHTDAQLAELASTPEAADQFTELNLNSSGVSDGGLAVLPKFEHVEKLSIDGCQYSNAGLANVAKMKSLTSLSMNGGAREGPRLRPRPRQHQGDASTDVAESRKGELHDGGSLQYCRNDLAGESGCRQHAVYRREPSVAGSARRFEGVKYFVDHCGR